MARFTVDISDELNRWLMRQATLNHRSKNKQLEYILTVVSKMPFFNATEDKKEIPKPEIDFYVCSVAVQGMCANNHHFFESDIPSKDELCNCKKFTFKEFRP